MPFAADRAECFCHAEAVYVPSDEERRLLVAALDGVENAPEKIRDWDQVRAELRAGR